MTINTTDLTTQLTTGDGVFDVLMGGVRSQLQVEFDQNRIRGNDYATVFTALVSAALQSAVQYTLQKPLVDQQVINTAAELDAINLKDDMIAQEILNLQAVEAKVKAETLNVPKQGILLDEEAETANLTQLRIAAETVNVGKQGNVIDAQRDNLVSENKVIELQDDMLGSQIVTEGLNQGMITAQTANVIAEKAVIELQDDKLSQEILNLKASEIQTQTQTINIAAELPNIQLQDDLTQKQIAQVEASTVQTTAQTVNIEAETLNVPKQGLILDAQKDNLISENKVIELQDDLTTAQIAQTTEQTANIIAERPAIQLKDDLITQQIANEVSTKANIEANTANTVAELPNHHLMDDKTQAEIDYLDSQKDVADANALKAVAENALLTQKKITEQAQTEAIANPNSVIGKQLVLYTNQANGYLRDQEVKAARLFADVATVQLNINENYDTATNGLNDASIKKALDKVRIGVGAV